MEINELMDKLNEKAYWEEAKKKDVLAIALHAGHEVSEAGRNQHKMRCPFHDDHNPSFFHNASKGNFFKCFACEESADAIKLYAKLHHVSTARAVVELNGDRWIEAGQLQPQAPAIPAKAPTHQETSRRPEKQDIAVYAEFLRYLSQAPENQDAISYLNERGITADIRKKYGITTIANTYEATNHMRKRFAPETLAKSGLFNEKNNLRMFKHVIVIPYFFRGQPWQLQRRNIEDESPKYTFLKGIQPIPYMADDIEALQTGEYITLTSGAFDAIIAKEKYYNKVFSIGSEKPAIPGKTLKKIKAKKAGVIIAYDNDGTGNPAAEKLKANLAREGVRASIAVFQGGKDINEAALHEKPPKKPNFEQVLYFLDQAPEGQWIEMPAGWGATITQLAKENDFGLYDIELSPDHYSFRKIIVQHDNPF